MDALWPLSLKRDFPLPTPIVCMHSCGACGGRGRGTFGGGVNAGLGRDFCCISSILDNGEFCTADTEDAPCIICELLYTVLPYPRHLRRTALTFFWAANTPVGGAR